MKKRKILSTIAVLILCIIMAVPVGAATNISNKSLVLISGQTKQLKVLGTKRKAKWYSNNRNVATVTSTGKVTAKRKGNAVITAKANNNNYTCKVTVETPSISRKSITLNKGKRYTLKITGTKQKVLWKSSKKSVASINSKGVVIANGYGKATITAQVGEKSYKCIVTVNRPLVYLSEKSRTIYQGQSFDLLLKNSNSKVAWSTSNRNVASIKKISTYKYRVTGRRSGMATITVKSGSKKYTCKVTVKTKARELFPGKRECGSGTFYIYFASGTSQGGKIPTVYVDRRFPIGFVDYHVYGVNKNVPVHVYIDAEQVDVQYVPYGLQASMSFADGKMKSGTHVVEMVQYEKDNPKGKVITYRKARYKVVYK